MNRDWVFDNRADASTTGTVSKPTARRFRKLLRREQEALESLLPPATESQPDADAPPNPTGRAANGRFAKGNKGGTGNPFARQIAGFRKALVNAVTETDMAELARILLHKAREGDVAAMKLLFAYVLGKPAEAPDPDRLDLDDFQLLRERLSPMEHDWLLIKKMTPVDGLVEMSHHVADLRAARWREEVLGDAQEPETLPTSDVGTTQPSLSASSPENLVRNLLALLREQTERTRQVLAKNGTPGTPIPTAIVTPEASAPSRNGANGEHPPSRNGANGEHAPSRNGDNGMHAPSGNGDNGAHAPSGNGDNGMIANRPSSNGVVPLPELTVGSRPTL